MANTRKKETIKKFEYQLEEYQEPFVFEIKPSDYRMFMRQGTNPDVAMKNLVLTKVIGFATAGIFGLVIALSTLTLLKGGFGILLKAFIVLWWSFKKVIYLTRMALWAYRNGVLLAMITEWMHIHVTSKLIKVLRALGMVFKGLFGFMKKHPLLLFSGSDRFVDLALGRFDWHVPICLAMVHKFIARTASIGGDFGGTCRRVGSRGDGVVVGLCGHSSLESNHDVDCLGNRRPHCRDCSGDYLLERFEASGLGFLGQPSQL